MQHGSLSTILEPCIATPPPHPYGFFWVGGSGCTMATFLDQIGFRNVGWGWGSRSTWSTPRKPQQQTQTTYGINRGVWSKATLIGRKCSLCSPKTKVWGWLLCNKRWEYQHQFSTQPALSGIFVCCPLQFKCSFFLLLLSFSLMVQDKSREWVWLQCIRWWKKPDKIVQIGFLILIRWIALSSFWTKWA